MKEINKITKKRVPTPKLNTCIKWHHLGRTATALTLEELGLLYFMLQVVDDDKNKRYELITDNFTKELLTEKEKEYIKLFDNKMRENPLFRVLFEAHAGQIKSSRNYYEALVKRVVENNYLVDEMQGIKSKLTEPEAEASTLIETPEENEFINDCEFDEDNIRFYNETVDMIESAGYTTEQVATFIYNNPGKFSSPIRCIDDVLIAMYNQIKQS